VVDGASPEESRYILWDSDLSGFGLRVEPSGHKSFVARYRAGGGRTGVLRQSALGRYGNITVDEARTAARRLLGAAAGGGDPVGEKKTRRQAGITVAEVCSWYLEAAEAGSLLGRRGRPIKASTLAMDRSRIEQHVKPLIGKKAVSSLTLIDLEEMQARIATGKTAAPKAKEDERRRGGVTSGGNGVAARTLGMVRSIFEHAIRKGVVRTNPARGVRRIADGQRRVRLTLDQVRALGRAMKEATAENAVALSAIRFVLLSGFRRDEALSLKPEQLLPAGGIDLPDSKSGPQVRPVGRAALASLKGVGSHDWIFPAERGEGHFIGLPKVLVRICTKAELNNITPHVLRHTFASIAGDLGYSELTIAGLLGHTAGSVTTKYVHLDAALVAAADRVSGVIADALDGKPAAKVMPMRRRTSIT
jgi:integrase